MTYTSGGETFIRPKVCSQLVHRLLHIIPNKTATDEFPGHMESAEHLNDDHDAHGPVDERYIAEAPLSPPRVRVDKSNLLLLGPTGCGKTYILE